MANFKSLYPKFPFSLPLLLDGATGTAMMHAGMPAGVCPEEWILNHPDALTRTQYTYFHAGSDAVLTPTFGANLAVLHRYGLENRLSELNRNLAMLSRITAGREHLVGGDIAPSGHFMPPLGSSSMESLMDDHRTQIDALEPYVDFFMIETYMNLSAARAAVLAVKERSTKPVFVTLTVTASGKTMSGDTPEAALLTLAECGITAFGLNCSTGPAEMLPWLSPMLSLSVSLGIPLIAKPNAGPPDANGLRTPLSPALFGETGSSLLCAGIGILGGCCGTNATHITALREAMNAFNGIDAPIRKQDLARLFCDSRTIMSFPDTMPEPIIPDDNYQDIAADMADNCGFAFVKLNSQADAETVINALPLCLFPIVVTGDKDAIVRLKRAYCGKLLII